MVTKTIDTFRCFKSTVKYFNPVISSEVVPVGWWSDFLLRVCSQMMKKRWSAGKVTKITICEQTLILYVKCDCSYTCNENVTLQLLEYNNKTTKSFLLTGILFRTCTVFYYFQNYSDFLSTKVKEGCWVFGW